ncbi:MAG: hypothetical protein IPM71_11015 [Bacteroidota bacterium]|nr:MAG: hypothetical protein IPM71_11015 [Bacteroidota bacterium]
MNLTEILVPLGFFAAVALSIFFVTSALHKEKMAMIEKGIFERKQPKRSKNMGLKAGTLFIGLGIGIFFGYLLGEFTVINEVVSFFSMILLFGGAALIFNNFMLAKKDETQS